MILAANVKKPLRWKLLLWLQLFFALVWMVCRQLPFLEGMGALGAVDLLYLVLVIGVTLSWLLLMSRMKWKARFIGGVLLCASLGVVKIDGHTGSFFPQFSWRWEKKSAQEIPEITGEVAIEGTVIESEGEDHFPRFLGAEMKNWVAGSFLPKGWETQKPKELWRKESGEGWSSFSVAGGFAYTMEQRGNKEATICYELRTGRVVWLHGEDIRFEESMGDDGPRSTPTVVEGKVVSLGATGQLNCLDARTGKQLWGKNILEEVQHRVPTWAKSCSPLIVDGKVVVTLGKEAKGNLAAYDLNGGALLWRAGDYSSSYASPVVATLAGKRQIVALQQKSVNGYDIETGEVLWGFPIGNKQGNCASPLIFNDTVITSSGYGYGTHRIQITKQGERFQAEGLWKSLKLKAKFADMVIWERYLYGLNDGRMVCLNLETGKAAWRGTNVGHGQILGVGDHLIIQHETGEISVMKLTSEGQELVNEIQALKHRTWNHPILAGRILLVRNDREMVAFEF